MRDKITSQVGELLLSEYVNVTETGTLKSAWNKKWGEIVEDVLYLYPSNKQNTQASHKIKIRGFEIHPAAKETGRILAFKLVNKNTCAIVLEPLNIQDMGRWISSLFAAIQGYYISNNLLIIETSKPKEETKNVQKAKNSGEPEVQDARPGFLVNVRSLAQKFEKLAVPEPAEKPQPKDALSRSVSTPNLTHNENIIILSSNGEVNGEKQTEIKTSTNRHSTSIEVQQVQGSASKHVKNYKGPYMAQDEEKVVLDTLTNPYLAKRKLVKQEQQIQRLEATVKSISERIARQKKVLGETKFAIQDLKSQSTDSQDQSDIIAMEEQSAMLQKQITQSESSIKDYNQTIHQLEDEMIDLSKYITWDKQDGVKVEKKEVKLVAQQDGRDTAVAIQARTEVKENGSTSEAAVNAKEDSSDEEELGMGAPAWAREAQRKSRAFKKLEKQGIFK